MIVSADGVSSTIDTSAISTTSGDEFVRSSLVAMRDT